MSSDDVFAGVALIVVLAVGSQVLARQLRVPGIIVLLPVGFTVGALTDDVHPDRLLGSAFSPLVSLAVAVILYDAGLELDLRRLTGGTRRTLVRLIWIGTLATWVVAAVVAAPLLDISAQAAAMLGVILIVSGPTVVGPLLSFARPSERLREILLWEGSLIDAVGGVLGALVFAALASGRRVHAGSAAVHILVSAAVGRPRLEQPSKSARGRRRACPRVEVARSSMCSRCMALLSVVRETAWPQTTDPRGVP